MLVLLPCAVVSRGGRVSELGAAAIHHQLGPDDVSGTHRSRGTGPRPRFPQPGHIRPDGDAFGKPGLESLHLGVA